MFKINKEEGEANQSENRGNLLMRIYNVIRDWVEPGTSGNSNEAPMANDGPSVERETLAVDVHDDDAMDLNATTSVCTTPPVNDAPAFLSQALVAGSSSPANIPQKERSKIEAFHMVLRKRRTPPPSEGTNPRRRNQRRNASVLLDRKQDDERVP